MMRRYLLGFILLLMLASVSARVTYHGDTLQTQYGAGEIVRGTLNVTFNKTDLDAPLRTNFGTSNVTLRAVLEGSGFIQGEDYVCNSATCQAGFSRKEAVSDIEMSSSALVGFSLQGGSITGIDSTHVTFESNAPASCFLDLSLDVLNQSTYYLTSQAYTPESCYEPRYGCFEHNRGDHDTVIMQSGREYCEKILLPVAPAFLVGANVTVNTQGITGLRMRLHSLDSTPLGECTLPSIAQASELVSCTIPYASATQREYLVCVEPTGAGSNYRIRVETNQPCGTNDFTTYPGDYEIFAQNLRFDTPRITLSESSFESATGNELNAYLSAYISEVYNGNCNPYCILPLRLFGASQTLSVTSPFIQYTSSLGQHTSSNVYRLERDNATINANRLVLDLSRANLTIPLGASGNRLRVYIGDEEIVTKSINLSTSFAFNLNTGFATFGQPTTFTITVPGNITSARWNFGDGSMPQTTTGKTITYRYLTQGTFNLEVEVTRADGITSRRIFNIVVGNAQQAATLLLTESQQHYADITTDLANYPSWIKEEIQTQIGYTEMKQGIDQANVLYGQAGNDSDYVVIVNNLITLNVPESIETRVSGTVPLVTGLENADISPLRTLTGSEQGSDEEVRRAVASWMLENTNADIQFSTIVARYDQDEQPLVTMFKIQTHPQTAFPEEVNLIIGLNANDVHLASSYAVQAVDSATVINMGTSNEVFEFSVSDALTPEQLGAYISPAIERLGEFEEPRYDCNFNAICEADSETWRTCPNDCRPWGPAVIVIIVVVIVGAIVLGLILWWYKRKYESSLFPNRQDLTNILSFIDVSSKAGNDDKEIRKKLKKASWTGEQINYALKKYRKTKGRAPNVPSDVRFIKRPDFKAP